MSFCILTLAIIGIILLLVLIFGLPRKKSERKPNMEGIESPEVAQAFNRMTKIPPFKLLYMKIVSQIKKLNPHGTLVDVGCGAGNLIIRIAKKIPELTLNAVDIAPEILEYAKKRAIENSVEDKIDFKIGSVEELPFPENSIDFIVSTLSLHHWDDPKKAFKEILRVLKQDGTFLIFDFRRDSRKIYHGFLAFITKIIAPKALKNVKEPLGSIQSSYELNEIRHILTEVGVKDVGINSFLAWMFITNKKSK